VKGISANRLDRREVSLRNFIKAKDVASIRLYRYITFERLAAILTQNEMELFRTSSWDDPYENFLHRVRVPIGNYFTSLKEFEGMSYGQCWTLAEETDAMWRIYSPTLQAVKIRTTVSKLAEASRSETKYKPLSTRSRVVGAVKYLYKSEVQKLIRGFKAKVLPFPSEAFEALFIKRMEFAHEREVRLVIVKNAQTEDHLRKFGDRKQISLKIDPNSFIEEVILDPRLSNSQTIIYKKMIGALGYSGTVKRSSLYQPPKV